MCDSINTFEGDKANKSGEQNYGINRTTPFKKQFAETYIKEDFGKVRSECHQNNQSTQNLKDHVVEDRKSKTESSESIDILDIPCKDIFLGYLELTKIKPEDVKNKIAQFYSSIQTQNEHCILLDSIDKSNDIRQSMIKFVRISEILKFYESHQIMSEYVKEKANNIVSEYKDNKLYFNNKCSSEDCRWNTDCTQDGTYKTSKLINLCILPNFDWMHQECIQEYFDQTRKKYWEVREQQASKKSITSIMEEDLDVLNKIFILTEFVLAKSLITNVKFKSLDE